MALSPGTRLGAYEIIGFLGAGGMGEVYRARDTKLQRDVALKVLPDAFAADVERLARFRREAQVLATLNHTHIAQIYGLEEAPGTPDASPQLAVAMELVEGDGLDTRVARGPLPVAEALAIARQIAEALDAAHSERPTLPVTDHRKLGNPFWGAASHGQLAISDFGARKAMNDGECRPVVRAWTASGSHDA